MNRPIRVLVISEPAFAGVKRHVCETLREIDTKQFEVAFAYSTKRADSTFEHDLSAMESNGVETHEVPMSRGLAFASDIAATRKIRQLIRSFRPDIVHCHSVKAGLVGRLAARSVPNRPITVYTPNAMPCFASSVFQVLEKLAGRLTDWIIAVSESERDDIIRWGIKVPERIVVIPMGVSSAQVRNQTEHATQFTVGGCGRICHQKNALLFFQAGELLLESFPDARLRWIGDFSDDSESNKVEDLIKRSKFRDRITVTGWVDNATDEMAKLDVFCMFSRYESFGFVTADAMRIGVPVVGTNTTGTRDLINDKETGILVEAAHPSSVHEALKNLYWDTTLRNRLVENARQTIESRYDPRQCLEALERFYVDVASGMTPSYQRSHRQSLPQKHTV